MNKFLKTLGFSLLLLVVTPVFAANAFDIPLLNWEKGRVQEVVLGNMESGRNWKLELVGKQVAPIRFIQSGSNAAGYIVYSAMIPENYPAGAYTVETSSDGQAPNVVAGVNLIEASHYDIRKTISDLSFVIALLAFITVTFSSLRSRKYAHVSSISEQPISYEERSKKDPISKILRRLINLRKELTREIKPSLYKHLLQQESETLFKLSRPAYFGLPIIGIIGGYWVTSNATANNGLGFSSIYLFVLIACLGMVDSFSGIMAMFSFWFVEFFNGNVDNLTELMIVLAVGMTWAGPALIARIYLEAVPKDFVSSKFEFLNKFAQEIGILVSALVSGAIFYGGFKLSASLIQEVGPNWSPTLLQIVVVMIFAAGKGFLQVHTFHQEEMKSEIHEFELVRVTSPRIAVATFAMIFGITYVWTSNFLVSLGSSTLFSLPYFLLFVRFENIGIPAFAKLPRNIFIEALVAGGLSLLIFRQIQGLPQLADQKAEIFLIVAAIPVFLHGIYSSICDSVRKNRTIV